MKAQILRDKRHHLLDLHLETLEDVRISSAVTRAAVQGLSLDRCVRCGGFVMREWCEDLYDAGGRIEGEMIRCIQCGHREDPLMVRNRALS
ncbi:MAG: hypothetical protein ACREJU_17520 [Nitrospiraceae bacterium]